MSRHLVKASLGLLSGFLALFGISAACSISPDAGWQYAFADDNCQVPESILGIKRVIDSGDHFQGFMAEWDKDIRFMAVPSNFQRIHYNADYTGLVYNLWFNQGRKTDSKLRSSLQGLLPDLRAKYKDEGISFEERTKFAYLYFLNFAVVDELNGIRDHTIFNAEPSFPTSKQPNTSAAGLTFIQHYYTTNGMQYALRHSDLFYLFSKGESMNVNVERRARSLDDLINYLEHQNRIVYRAPNGRYYAIRKFNNSYKINRDNGTLLPQAFPTYKDAEFMLKTCAVHGNVEAKYRGLCGFGSYGKR